MFHGVEVNGEAVVFVHWALAQVMMSESKNYGVRITDVVLESDSCGVCAQGTGTGPNGHALKP
jgi:hypothetical protein